MMQWLQDIENHLVEDWRKMMRWWSVQWALLGAVLLPLLNAAPQVLPTEIANMLPPAVRATATGLWCVMFIVFRAWQQKHPDAK